MLRDLVQAETGHIYVDSRQNFEALKDFARKYVPSAEALLVHYTGERPLFEVYGVDEEIERALGRRVPLKSGGYLVVDQTEAMTLGDRIVIMKDGFIQQIGFVGKRDFSQTVFKTNLEAAQTIARQLRLRNLGGIIIIDFIDMASDEHRAAVLS